MKSHHPLDQRTVSPEPSTLPPEPPDPTMNDVNVYAPPQTDIRQSVPGINGGDAALQDLNTKEVKKLYNNSRSIGALVFLWCLGAILMSFAAFGMIMGGRSTSAGQDDTPVAFLIVVFVGIVAINLAGVVGCWTRQGWGRVVGFILCALMLLNIPLGTIIGLFGLIALSGGARLFGPNRLTHQQLKAEVAFRKKNNIR